MAADAGVAVLFADVLLLGILLPRFYGTLKVQMRDEYRFTTARRWAIWVSTLLLGLQSIPPLDDVATQSASNSLTPVQPPIHQ